MGQAPWAADPETQLCMQEGDRRYPREQHIPGGEGCWAEWMDRLNTDVVVKKHTIYPWRVLELG